MELAWLMANQDDKTIHGLQTYMKNVDMGGCLSHMIFYPALGPRKRTDYTRGKAQAHHSIGQSKQTHKRRERQGQHAHKGKRLIRGTALVLMCLSDSKQI